MTAVPFTQVAHMLAVDAKTLRQWMKHSNLSLQPHSTDARIKCLTIEQVHLLANLHGKVLPLPTEPCVASHEPSVATNQMAPVTSHDAKSLEKLIQLQAQVASQQEQIAHLALQLLQERAESTEQRLLTLEAFLTSIQEHLAALSSFSVEHSPQTLPLALRPAEKRVHLIPLIEYSASGSYVLICPKEGELHITPDSSEWFAWLASLSSFRFVGRDGRFSARRGSSPRSNRSWYAQRKIHQKNYRKYIGVSENVTITRLEKIAAILQYHAQ
jgi:hypothetical protein